MTPRFLWAAGILAALAGVAGCAQGGNFPPPPLVIAPSNPQPEGQQGKGEQEGAKAEAEPASNSVVSLGLLIDVSGSMSNKMAWVVEALHAFIRHYPK